MRIQMRLLVLLATVAVGAAYKMVLLAPAASNSQVIFNKRVAETLAKAGHDVTIAMIHSMEGFNYSDVKIANNAKLYTVEAFSGYTREQFEESQSSIIFEDLSFFDKRMQNNFAVITNVFTESCRTTLRNKKFMKWLKDSQFDLAFVHVYHACPIGLVHAAGIPWIWLSSGALVDHMADAIGVPLIPSYVPPIMMAAHDQMTFLERTKSFIGHQLTKIMWPRMIANPETQMFREEWDPNFPDLVDLARNCSLVMVNSNPLYDLPRPTLAIVVNIGGIGAQLKNAKPLPKDLEDIVHRGDGAVLMSFGSIAPAHKMPTAWKTSLLKAFAALPNLQFILRYVDSDLNDRLPPNVHLRKWLPQSDLLQHPRVKAFISHGGYNSLQEAIAAGKPLVMVPLMGDQPKNAKIAEKHGIARILEKGDFHEDRIVEHIRALTSNPSYTNSARRLSAMVANQPIPSEMQIVKWAEFLAKFKNLDNLAPVGKNMNFITYHSLDVIGFLASIVILIVCVVAVAVIRIRRFVNSIFSKSKVE